MPSGRTHQCIALHRPATPVLFSLTKPLHHVFDCCLPEDSHNIDVNGHTRNKYCHSKLASSARQYGSSVRQPEQVVPPLQKNFGAPASFLCVPLPRRRLEESPYVAVHQDSAWLQQRKPTTTW